MTVATVSDLTYFYFTWWSQSSPWGSRSKHLYLQWLSVLEDTLTFTILPIYWLSGELSSLLQRRYINIHLWLWMDKRRQSLKLSSDLHYFTSRVHSLPWGFRLSLKSQHKIQTLLEGTCPATQLQLLRLQLTTSVEKQGVQVKLRRRGRSYWTQKFRTTSSIPDPNRIFPSWKKKN